MGFKPTLPTLFARLLANMLVERPKEVLLRSPTGSPKLARLKRLNKSRLKCRSVFSANLKRLRSARFVCATPKARKAFLLNVPCRALDGTMQASGLIARPPGNDGFPR